MVPYNFLLINYEPWTVDSIMKKHENDPEYLKLKWCINNEGLTGKLEAYSKIVKILDLWAFGNSIIEIMVGKCSESINFSDESNAASAKTSIMEPEK